MFNKKEIMNLHCMLLLYYQNLQCMLVHLEQFPHHLYNYHDHDCDDIVLHNFQPHNPMSQLSLNCHCYTVHCHDILQSHQNRNNKLDCKLDVAANDDSLWYMFLVQNMVVVAKQNDVD